MIIIGVSGKARSGKGEFAKIAVEKFGFTQVSFAGALKKEVESFLTEHGVPYERRNLYGENADKEETFVIPESEYIPIQGLAGMYGDHGHASFRSLLQWWGTEFRRNQSENYWVDQVLAQCVETYDMVETMMGPIPVPNSNSRYVIDDMRFENEANALLEVDAKLVRIERPNNPHVVSNPNHPSETGLDEWNLWHWVVENSSNLEDHRQGCRIVIDDICYGD